MTQYQVRTAGCLRPKLADNRIGFVQAVLLAVYQETTQASENKEALVGLVTKARDIIQR